MSGTKVNEKLLPAHLKPKDDELLSSWLVRLARAHSLKLHTFCSLVWPGKQIWNRDIDKSADSEIVEVLSAGTGTSIERSWATTLIVYEGILYEKHNRFGPSPWIMPVGVYHRTRRQFGLQFCPRCLAEDKEPYYRRKWRLAFVAVCERHYVQLHDRCPKCGEAVNFHRCELSNHRKFGAVSLTLCHACNFKLHKTEKQIVPVTPEEVEFTGMLLQSMHTGFVRISKDVIAHSHLFFAGLRQLMKIVAMRDKRIVTLRQAVVEAYRVEAYMPVTPSSVDIQELGVEARRQLLGLVRCLLENWPQSFVKFSTDQKVWSSLWLRHLEPSIEGWMRAPFWFWSIVHDDLYRAKYCPSGEEINAAIKYLRMKRQPVNKSTLARLLGTATVRQKTNLSQLSRHSETS